MEAPEGDELDAWQVYADWLQARGDPDERALGEAIIVGDACTEQRDAWLGPLATPGACYFDDWRGGFPRVAKVYAEGATPSSLLATVLGHRASRRLEQLAIETVYEDDTSVASIVELLVATRRPRGLRGLAIAGSPSFDRRYRTSPVAIGDVSGLWRGFALERLELEGEQIRLGSLTARHLRELRLEPAGREPLARIANAELPALVALDLCLGAETVCPEPGWRDVAMLLAPILDNAGLPALRELTVRTKNDHAADTMALLPFEVRMPPLAGLALVKHTATVQLLAPYNPALSHVVIVRLSGRQLG